MKSGLSKKFYLQESFDIIYCMGKVVKIKADKDLEEAILETVQPFGGFKGVIDKGDVVLLKPNFNTADLYPASTDLNFLKTVVKLAYKAEPKTILVGDSSTMSLNTREVMEELGVFELENMSPAPRIYVFDERDWREKEIPGGQYLKKVSITEYLDRVDKTILLPCLKTHSQAEFTGSLKLSVGFMKSSQRVGLHKGKIQEKVAELNKVIHPDLAIMDARKCFINEGPSEGETAEPNLILASKSRLALDKEGVRIIKEFKGNSLENIKPEGLTQIKKASEFGIDSE